MEVKQVLEVPSFSSANNCEQLVAVEGHLYATNGTDVFEVQFGEQYGDDKSDVKLETLASIGDGSLQLYQFGSVLAARDDSSWFVRTKDF